MTRELRRISLLASSALFAGLVVVPTAAASAVGAQSQPPVAQAPGAAETMGPPAPVRAPATTGATTLPTVVSTRATAPGSAALRAHLTAPPARSATVWSDRSCPRSLPTGPIAQLAGPASTVFVGSASCRRSVWTMTVTGGSGRIAGMALASRSFGGTLTWQRGLMSGGVIIRLSAHPVLVPDWTQSAYVSVVPWNPGWHSTVRLAASSGRASRLALSGNLRTDGSYQLSAAGTVTFAGTRVPLSGWYRSPGVVVAPARRTTAPTWSISGRGRDGAIAGAAVVRPQISMTQATAGVTGRASLRLTFAPFLVSSGSLRVVNSGSWSLSARGSSSRAWAPPHSAGVSADLSAVSGSIGYRRGVASWSLAAPMTMTSSSLAVRGVLTFAAPNRYLLTARSGTGSILGDSASRSFVGGTDSIVLTPTSAGGHLSLVADGELLIDLPEGWTSSTTFTLSPRTRGATWSMTYGAAYRMRNGASDLRLSGSSARTDVFALSASGVLAFSGSLVPFHGYFWSKGYVVGGRTLTAPEWAMHGSPGDASGRGVPLDGGAALVGGVIGFSGGHGAPDALPTLARAAAAPTIGVLATLTPTSVAGQGLLQIAANSTFLLPVTYTYTDQDNWTITCAGTTPGNVYNPYTGLAIPETSFHGTATDVKGTQTWNVTVDALSWSGMAKGVTLSGSLTVSNTCPLAAHCPSTGGIFFSGTSNLTFDDGLPTVSATGAFLADKSWARWDGTTSTLSWNAISVSSPTLTVWKGERDDENPDLVMPDLSSHNGNGLGLEFCGTFHVVVPDVVTSTTFGCVEWSKDGVVMGQVSTGGSVSQGGYNGISLHGTSLTGYAWSNLADEQGITLNGQQMSLDTGKNYLTGNLGIPGNVMHDVGAGTSSDTTIPAEGWFTTAGDFSLDGFIPVSMKSSGFALNSISVHIGKSGHDFTLSMGADCTVAINGNHFPLSVYIGYEHSGDSSITVRMDAHGVASTQPSGQMDFTSLLPTGTFEPTNTALVDGSFDSALPKNVVKDTGFENASTQGSLVTNGDFETNISNQLVPDGGFEDGSTTNVLANGGSEDLDILYNGDFESNGGSTLVGWNNQGSYGYSIGNDTASGASEAGTYAAWITNTSGSGSQVNSGMYQKIPWAPPAGTTITVSGWVRGDTASKTPFNVYLNQTGCTVGSYTTTSATVQVDNTAWVQSTVIATAQNGCTGLTVTLDPTSAGGHVVVDAWSAKVSSVPSSTTLPTVWRPHVQSRFDTMASTPFSSYTSGVSIATDIPGTLRSNGVNGWMLSSTSYGYASGDFDMSVKVRFPSGSNTRDIADIGFWMNSASPHNTGYAFRLQTSSGDGGFMEYAANGNNAAEPGRAAMPDVARDVWYQVRLTAVSDSVTAYVTRLDTNAQVFVQTLTMTNNYPHSGSFGQFVDGAGSTEGSRWDDLAVYSSSAGSQVRLDPTNAHSGNGYTVLKGTVANWGAEYSTGESPAQWSQYSYSAWVRSTGGNVSGNLALSTDGGTYEVATQPFTATSAWQQVSVTLRMNQSGHTDLRPGFLSMATTGLELQVDDQVLQQVPWRTYPDNVANALTEITSSDAHGGAQSMQLVDHNNGSTALLEFPSATNVSGPVYTLSAWVKSASPVTGALRFQESGGGSSVPFTATSTWTQYTVTRTSTGGNIPYVAIDLGSGHQGQALLVDDVSLTVTKIDAAMAPALGAPPQAATWTNQGSHVIVKNDATTAHSGSGTLQIVPAGGSTQATSYTVSAAPNVGSSWSTSMWLYTGDGGGVSTTVALSDGLESTSRTVTATTTYQQVTLTLPVTKSGATSFTITVTNNNTSANGVRVDDVALNLQGLAPVDAWWTSDSGGFTSYAVLSDSSKAFKGNNYLEVAEHNGSVGGIDLDASYKATPGTTHEQTFQVRSATGGNVTVTGSIHTFDVNGKVLDQRSVTWTVGTTWTQEYVSLPITNANATTIRVEIDVSKGAVVDIDEVESRDVASWSTVTASGVTTDEAVIADSGSAANGANYLAFAASSSGGGIGTTVAQSIVAGSSYKLDAYVRSNTGSPGALKLTYGGSSTESSSVAFSGTGSWQEVSLQFTATKSNSTITPQVLATAWGLFDVDTITLTPVLIGQSDPWTRTDSATTFGVYDDPTRAHDSSYGLLEMSRSGSNTSGVQHSITQSTALNQVYNATAWVRSSSGTPISGSLSLATVGGTAESASQAFTASATWQLVSLRLPIAQAGHTGFVTKVLLSTAGATLDVDDVMVQQNPWVAVSDSGGTATQTVMTDGASAQSGTGFLRLLNTGSAGGDAYLDTTGSFSSGQTWAATVYVRSSTGSSVTGVLSLGATGGTPVTQAFTATGAWTPVTVSYPVTGSPASLRTDVRVTTAGSALDIDTATLDDGTPPPDGVTTPLPHPSTGWTYLWDNAFGIPGAHLWSMTAQVQFVNGHPGLGVGATLYHDPTKSPNVMSGTDWLKGDMALNVSRYDPCFTFDFASTGNSKISVAGGVFTATSFSMNFAPRGCTVGAYVVPKGASLSFDGGLGSASVHFDMAITTGDDGPEFTENLGITDLVLAGTTYKNIALSIDLSATKHVVAMAADMTLPMGGFTGSFNLSVSSANLHMDGDVTLTSWSMAGGGFTVQDFNYHQSMDIPFGAGSCASFTAGTSGHMTMAKRSNLQFEGDLEVDCGKLQVLHFDYDYSHGGVTQKFNLDYDASTHLLAGGSFFSFERSSSWKFLSHRYHRHPYIALGLSFSMDTTKPSSATATLGGTVSVSGGDGSLSCTINGDGQDDYCHIHVHLSVGGGHTFDDTW